MHGFTTAASLLVRWDDYETGDIRIKKVLVFLSGALDALLQHHKIADEGAIEVLWAYLKQTFPEMTSADLQVAISFICDASANPAWIPIRQSGGQAMLDWWHGDSVAPARLAQIV